METLNEVVKNQEQPPLVLDVFDPEIEKMVRKEGQIYYRNANPITNAEQSSSVQMIETVLQNGTTESLVEAKPGDWIITGEKGEKYVLAEEKFASLYRRFGDEIIPKKHRIIAVKNPYGQPIKVAAPWSTEKKQEYQEGGKESFLAFTIDEKNGFLKDRYIIGNEELLLSNYQRSLEQFRHLKGLDEAVSRIGTREQFENLVEVAGNPEKYSREEFVDAMIENYSGEIYGDTHISKEYKQWGGPNDGERVVTTYGRFREKYPRLVQLSLDPAFMNHLHEFMEIVERENLEFTDYKEARKMLKEKLGIKEVYRGMTLSLDEVESIKNNGIISSIGREMKNSTIATEDEIEAKVLSVRVDDALRHHFYGGASLSSFISVSEQEELASALGETFGKKRTGENRKNYVIKMKVPLIELVYEEQAHKVEKERESFVFWKINPDEIFEISEVKEK